MNLNARIGSCSIIQNRERSLGAPKTTQRFAKATPAVAAASVQIDAAAMQRCDSLKQLLDQCSGVLLDQFGVLHDGRKPYPHAVAAVQCLFEAGKQIIILSNSSRRSTGTIGKLSQMGFKPEWFSGKCRTNTGGQSLFYLCPDLGKCACPSYSMPTPLPDRTLCPRAGLRQYHTIPRKTYSLTNFISAAPLHVVTCPKPKC